MKSATAALVTFLNDLRPTSDAPLQVGDLFTIWLANGSILTYTNLDLPVAWNGYNYSSSSVLVAGLRYKCSLGVSVDQQKITISARSTDTLGGIPFLQALQQGVFDGAIIQREKAFFSSWATTAGSLVPIGTAIMFKGRVAAIDEIGRTTAQVTVAADTVFLSINMPRRLWSPQCTHVLYDSGCGLARDLFSERDSRIGSDKHLDSLVFGLDRLCTGDHHFHV
ncbi:baseplate hub domain-containing protein, partial [Rhodoblastus sp.]|uniref:baseplate hub domain-containing protein n=1 Tax=Rhodoblastus sp. TaxID=1962975 RepID=UPI003F958135